MPSLQASGHIEFTLGVLTMHQQRAGKPKWHLGDTGEMLDIALGDVRIERVAGDVVQVAFPSVALMNAWRFLMISSL